MNVLLFTMYNVNVRTVNTVQLTVELCTVYCTDTMQCTLFTVHNKGNKQTSHLILQPKQQCLYNHNIIIIIYRPIHITYIYLYIKCI